MDKRCRGCLSTTSLFSWDDLVTENVSYADIFFRVTYFNRELFPEMVHLCYDCGDDIVNIYQFIRKATETEVSLKQEVYRKTLEFVKAKSQEKTTAENTSIDLTDIPEQQADNVTPKCEEFSDLSDGENEEYEFPRENQTFLSNAQTESVNDEQDLHVEEYTEENVEYQYTQEEQITELGFEPIDIDIDVVEVDVVDDSRTYNAENFEQQQEINLHTLESDISSNGNEPENSESNDCEYCGKHFTTARSKTIHVMSIHGEQEQNRCDECPKTFKDASSLAKHKQNHIKNRKKEYACTQCNMKFLSSNCLKNHMELHDENREKKFECDECDKSFYQKSALDVHKRSHSGKLIKCQVCDKRFPRFCDLKKHMPTHTGELSYECKYCNKLFKYSSSLYMHMRKEHMGYIYQCNQCSKQFDNKDEYLEHKEEHRLMPYKCGVCGHEFTKRIHLKNHIQSTHKIDDPDALEKLILTERSTNKYPRRKYVTQLSAN